MKRGRTLPAAALQALALALGLAVIAPAAHAQEAKKPRPDMIMKGDAACTRCHDETEEYPVLGIAKTRHGVRADARTPTCVSCHGQSETHANKPPDAKERPKPDRIFKRATGSPAEAQNQACLTCHQGGKRIHWQSSMHASRDVTCASCHQVHLAHDRARDKFTQAETCLACHKELRAQINRPSRHPIREGKVTCADCHNPHGSAGPKNMVRDNVNDTCYACHMEKRGPFVRNHQPVQENCAICHNPHGTTAPNLLKQRPPFLCQSCHEPTGHRSSPGSFPGGPTSTSAANLVARGCVNCHTNIHGTNNPLDTPASGQRVFRR
ncbi:MAG: DmsE family decaheme c-type cytochrome [Betaproteobacteria bacterium]|nr:DmsE family decaheme c-type cytochrome [Betaproteobacteria bacterium]